MANDEQATDGGRSSAALKAAAAAAATSAAAYGLRRVLAKKHADEDDDDDVGEGRSESKREELTHALSSKAREAKKTASRLKPRTSNASVLERAWGSASGSVLPVANDVASSLGAAVARKAPDIVRDELMPHFIEGFEKTS
jgi:hypothetical protein